MRKAYFFVFVKGAQRRTQYGKIYPGRPRKFITEWQQNVDHFLFKCSSWYILREKHRFQGGILGNLHIVVNTNPPTQPHHPHHHHHQHHHHHILYFKSWFRSVLRTPQVASLSALPKSIPARRPKGPKSACFTTSWYSKAGTCRKVSMTCVCGTCAREAAIRIVIMSRVLVEDHRKSP